jgi:nitric oxide reductase activation protein
VSAAFLLDMSASTDFPVPDPEAPPPPPEPPPPPDGEYVWGNWSAREPLLPEPPKRRVIDVARESLALMAQALETLGDSYAIWGFSGYGRDDVEFHVAKDFDDRLRAREWAALAAMQPRRSTRMGPAIRHAVARLQMQATRLKVLIVISDGYPQDRDYGPDRNDDEYGIQDTAQALREAQHAGVQTFCVTIDPAGHDYLRRMCPDERYLVIDEVAALPRELSKVYRALTA